MHTPNALSRSVQTRSLEASWLRGSRLRLSRPQKRTEYIFRMFVLHFNAQVTTGGPWLPAVARHTQWLAVRLSWLSINVLLRQNGAAPSDQREIATA